MFAAPSPARSGSSLPYQRDAISCGCGKRANGRSRVVSIANWLRLPVEAQSRLGVVVSKKVGNSVIRSRVKRLLRESHRQHQHELMQPLDSSWWRDRPLQEKDFGTVERDLITTLRQAGLLVANPAQHILLAAVRIYRAVVSPALGALWTAKRVRFTPTCSAYAAEAVRTHGALIGSGLAVQRICHCHPWGTCGHDPVPPKIKTPALKPSLPRSHFHRQQNPFHGSKINHCRRCLASGSSCCGKPCWSKYFTNPPSRPCPACHALRLAALKQSPRPSPRSGRCGDLWNDGMAHFHH